MYIKFPPIQRFGKQKENKSPKSAKGRVKSAASRPGSGVTDVSSVTVRSRPGSSVAKLGHVQKQASEALAKVCSEVKIISERYICIHWIASSEQWIL